MATLSITIFTLCAAAKSGLEWQGTVIHVTDGDTLWIQPASSAGIGSTFRKIRLDGMDAPEICQAYGRESALALKQLINQKLVTVATRRHDDYGREVAKVTLKNADVGAWMVSHGHAWSYHFRHSAGPYAAQEQAAQSARLGLFADSAPVQPSVFRKTHDSCHVAKNALRHTQHN